MSMSNNMSPPRLPNELLSQVFLEVDPHTLYTSVRALSRDWKQCVEERLLAAEFETGRWRVGLRVARKPKVGSPWRGGRAGGRDWEAPGAMWNELKRRAEEHATASTQDTLQQQECINDARKIYTDEILSRHGALEDELEPCLAPQKQDADLHAPVVHVIPLSFKRYDGESTTLQFGTPQGEMHALFEHDNKVGDPSRLDLDFSIVWRFPGDGHDTDEWGEADPENGWLSRFYCSTFDLETNENGSSTFSDTKLHSTPLARRVRRAITRTHGQSSDVEDEEDDEDDEDDDPEGNALHQRHFAGSSMDWVDRGHEYAALSLSLGTEFFVRRSARANLLLRRLEAAAEAAQMQRRRSGNSSTASTPRRSPRHAETPSLLAKRLDAVRSMQSLNATPSSMHRSASSSQFCSGSSTPAYRTPSSSSKATSSPAQWKVSGRSYSFVASTPPSEPARYNTRQRAAGPRIVRPVPLMSSGSVTPLPSMNVSGYTSVQHQAPIDEKAQERALHAAAASAENDDVEDRAAASPSEEDSSSNAHTKGYASKMAISSHHSVPRAHFSAKLVRIHQGSTAERKWQDGIDVYGREAVRLTTLTRKDPCTTWEWCR